MRLDICVSLSQSPDYMLTAWTLTRLEHLSAQRMNPKHQNAAEPLTDFFLPFPNTASALCV